MANELSTLIGEVVDGYRLGNLVNYSAAGAVLETEFGPDRLAAVIKIREGRPEDVDAMTVRWRHTLELRHPNVLRVYATGSSRVNEVPIAYVVIERADESLENVLGERALSADETREMLAPTVAALKYLHHQGYQHGCLEPSKLLAVGDQLKLSCDSAVPLRDGEAPTEDMWALGILIVQALTQRTPDRDGIADRLPGPFDEIVRHCLEPEPSARWTADQVEAHLTGRVESPVEAQPAVPETSVAEEAPQPADAEIFDEAPVHVEEDPHVASEPVSPVEPISRVPPVWEYRPPSPRAFAYDDEPVRPHRPRWVYAVGAGLILIALVLGVMWRKGAAVAPATSTVVPQPAVTQEAPAEAPVRQTPQPPQQAAQQQAAAPEPARPVPEVTAPASAKAGGWWVIVAAYNSREAAEKRVRALKKAWPRFDVTVAEAQSERSPYVVTVGQGLDQKEAEALRRRAVSSGMPRDAYIKKVM